jgi:hypothetical protein
MMAEVSITAKGGDLVLSRSTGMRPFLFGLEGCMGEEQRGEYRLGSNEETNLFFDRSWGWRLVCVYLS